MLHGAIRWHIHTINISSLSFSEYCGMGMVLLDVWGNSHIFGIYKIIRKYVHSNLKFAKMYYWTVKSKWLSTLIFIISKG